LIKSVGKLEHGCCDHKTLRNITCCAEKREIFLGGWLFAVGESWDGEEGEIGEKRVGRVGIY
jgi:hypothetical protein